MDHDRSRSPAGVALEPPTSTSSSDETIIDRLTWQLTHAAARLAVKTPEVSLTYGELRQQSDRVAWGLGSAQPASRRVAVLMDANVDYLIAMLGILRAAAVYVPLDPDYPPDRLQYMIDDAEVDAVICSARHFDLARRLTKGNCPLMDMASLPDSAEPYPFLTIPPSTLAYIIYTSGSTGQPKGVMQSHRNLVHHVDNYAGGLGIRAEDRLSFFYSYSFSAAHMDVFGALFSGASLYPHYLKHHSIDGLASWLLENRITVYHSIPSVFRQFVAGLHPAMTFPEIRAIDLAGEPLYASDLDGFRRHFSRDCLLLNHLALTECSVAAKLEIRHDSKIDNRLVPVGYAAPGVTLRVVDDQGEEVPPDTIGELTIESPYLSPGYWKRPELNATLFRKSPSNPDLVVYHTGDLAKRDMTGCLTHFGRKDNRIKVRGYTIEASEIETVLREHLQIVDAIVVAKPNRHDQLRLVAYLQCSSDWRPSVTALRRYLRERLPDFMVPSTYVWLDQFPTTPNGKIDRRGLPEPGTERPELDNSYQSPNGESEERLVTLWQQVLGIHPIGAEDNFFDLGGDSLLAKHLLTKIEHAFRVRLPLSAMVQVPTVRGLAELLASGDLESLWETVVQIRTGGSGSNLFFVHCGHGNVFRYFELADRLDPAHSVYAFQPVGLDGKEPVPRTVEAMAQRYIAEMRKVQPAGPYVLGGFSFGGLVAFEMARQLRNQGETIALLLVFDTVLFPNYRLSGAKLRQHAVKLAIPTDQSRGSYLGKKLKGQWRSLRSGVYSRLMQLPLELRLRQGRPIPVDRCSEYFQRLSASASRNYAPKPFGGDLLYFEGKGDRSSVWATFVQGALTICPIPCPHDELLREPYLTMVANRVHEALAKL